MAACNLLVISSYDPTDFGAARPKVSFMKNKSLLFARSSLVETISSVRQGCATPLFLFELVKVEVTENASGTLRDVVVELASEEKLCPILRGRHCVLVRIHGKCTAYISQAQL